MAEHEAATVTLDTEYAKSEPNMALRRRPIRPIVSIPLDVTVRDEFVKGDPSFFGLLCFGMTTAMINFINTGWSADEFVPYPTVYGLVYGGIGQLIAGILELIKGDSFAGTAFASFGCFWMGWGLLTYTSYEYPDFGETAKTGQILWCSLWCVHSAGFLVVTARKNVCMQAIFTLVVITFALQAAGVRDENANKAAGYFGFGAAAVAIYAAFAFLYKAELGWELPGVAPTRYY